MQGFSRPSFQDHAKLDVHFAGEQAFDAGGPSRDLMTLLVRAIRDSLIFEGPENDRKLTVDVVCKLYIYINLSTTVYCYRVDLVVFTLQVNITRAK